MHSASSLKQVAENLDLSPEEYENSIPLKEGVRSNKDDKYVPSDSPKAWGFAVDVAA